MTATPNPPAALDAQLAEAAAQGWLFSASNRTLCKTFAFASFQAATDGLVRVAALAEQHNHHPDFLLQYKRLTLTLTTHDTGGLSDKDFTLAEAIDAYLK